MKNVLLITSDQQHWSMLGSKHPVVKTPNLDRLAAMGTTYNRAYCPNPTCTPTRASIITGMYPSQHGAWTLGTKLQENVPTVGETFAENGYKTCLIGKAHFQPLASTEEYPSMEAYPYLQDLDYWREYKGPFYGFSEFQLLRNHVDEAHVGQHYALWLEKKGFAEWRDCYQKPTGTSDPQFLTWNTPEEYHYNAFITEQSIEQIKRYRQNDDNFFLWASYPDPHPPYLVPEPWASMYHPDEIELPPKPELEDILKKPLMYQKTQEAEPDFSEWTESGKGNHGLHSHTSTKAFYHPGTDDAEQNRKAVAVYYGMVSMMDHYIGKLLDFLESDGLLDSTMIVFTSDHGHFFGQHGLVAKGPFHYEDVIKVPFIAYHPEQVVKGVESEALVSLVDLAPTFLDYCDLKVPVVMSGKSQKKVFAGKEDSLRKHVIVENRHEPTKIFLHTYVDSRYKLTTYCNHSYGEFYDLETDPCENNNLWDEDEYQELKAQLLLKFLHAEMEKEPPFMPRLAGA